MTIYITDTETTGLKPPIHPTEIAWIHVDAALRNIHKTPVTTYRTYVERFIPGKPIEEEASRITGITMKSLEGCRKHTDFKAPAWEYLVGHNIAYDYRVLNKPAHVKLICTKELAMLAFDKTKYKDLRNHKLGTLIAYLYPDTYEEILLDQHGALSDCISVYLLLVKILPLIPYANTWDDLAKLTSQPKKGVEEPYNKEMNYMPFGKHKGVAFAKVPHDYLLWLQSRDNLSPPLQEAIKKVLK